jgi:hypothetical protein
LPVLAKQQGCEPVLVEGEHDLSCSTIAGSRRGYEGFTI